MKKGNTALVRAGLALVILAALIWYLSPQVVFQTLGQAQPLPLLAAVLVCPFFLLARMGKWYLILKQEVDNIGYWEIAPGYLKSMLGGLVTPLRLGEMSRVLFLEDKAVGSGLFILEKWIEVVCLVALALTGLAALLGGAWWSLLLLTAAVMWLGLGRIRLVAPFLARMLSKKAKKPNGETPALAMAIARPRVGGCTVLTILVFLLFFLQVALVMISMDCWPTWRVVVSYPLAMLANFIPITMSGFGTREAAAVFILGPEGVPQPVAMYGFLISTLISLAIPALAGLAIMAFSGVGISKGPAASSPSNGGQEQDPEDWDDFWDKRGQTFLGRIISAVRRNLVTTRLVDYLDRQTAPGTLIEAGCGTGEVTLRLAQRRNDPVVLVDISPKALAMARALAKSMGVEAETRLCDIAALSRNLPPQEDGTVYNVGVIEHFADCSAILTEMARVGRKGALAVIPEKSLFWTVFVWLSRRLKMVPPDFFIILYDEKALKALVNRAGLEVRGTARLRILGIIPYLGIRFGERQE